MHTKEQIHVLLCDPETGICEIPEAQLSATGVTIPAEKKPLRLLYFTDPICSSCWGIEPQLRKLKLEYGDYFYIEYRMGGLLKGWDSYGGKDVSNPTDVAHHWDEVSAYYQMPIDGDLWLEDPLASSYPPSIAFKAAQLQGEEKSLAFLRRIKEMVFLEKKNITRWEHLQQAALATGLDAEKLKSDFEGKAEELFEQDVTLARNLGVKGFPTIFFTDAEDNRLKVYGVKPYEQFEQTLLKLYPQAVKNTINTSVDTLFAHYHTLTSKEFAILSNIQKQEAETILNGLFEKGKITKYSSKNGELWSRK
ncbi:DsbA family protein [Rhodocytophaga rosea]|uniref:DsbA family protein n=1 Tax=Rhodocytophaga rosea TaxID=2704465 RepID=A0A6C0GWI6_9BACT|nr:ClpXP adapter SpxH family protein [Rhodocytophaga rosea]QHT71712.1 DsbA family protein [Rhodocytophaga rosea]